MIRNKKLATLVFFFFAGVVSHAIASVITGFGAGDFTFDAGASNIVPSQTSSAFIFSGTGDSFFAGTLATTTSGMSGVGSIYLTATVNTYTPASTVFFVDLYDSDFDYQTYSGAWTGYVIGNSYEFALTFVSTTLSGGGTFDGSVTALGLRNGSSGGTVNITLDTLATTSAVPEPATYAALFGAASLGLAIWRKRRKTTV